MSGPLTVQVLPDGAELAFSGDRQVVIGRDADADVVVLGDRTSRRHAVARPDGPSGWVLEDQSSNGTFHAGNRVASIPIDGDLVIELGHPDTGTSVRLCSLQASARRSQPVGGLSFGPLSAVYEPAGQVRIGRSRDNDIVVDDLLVSRHHAELRARGDRFEIVDLGSNNGTFVDGVRVGRRATIGPGALVSIGHHLFRLWEGRLEEYVDAGRVSFAAFGLCVHAGKRLLLDEVSFALDSGQFLAVLGPTGAGKSTLLRALIGNRRADEGRVLYNGRDVYGSYAELRNRIGFVPQDDLLHQQLTVRDALRYAAALRFPPDVAASERDQRVDEVMAELGLSERAGLVVSKLSGGQRKRTSVAIELLTKPSLLVLDEPTSGLDPGYEKSVMELLRGLADGGRTVITVTHSVQSLDRCDRILFLAPGGQTAFFGPPAETLEFFSADQYADVFQALDRAEPGQAKAAFTGSAEAERYVREPVEEQRRVLGAAAVAGPRSDGPGSASPQANWFHQFATLSRRYLAVIFNDRRNTALLVLQAPVLGILMLLVLGHDNLDPSHPGARGTVGTVVVALVLCATYLGAANSIREVVKERSVLARELSVGVSPSAYIASKMTVLGGLTVLQSVVLVACGLARQHGPVRGALLPSGWLEMFIVVTLTGLSAMALGLLVSALVSNPDKALTILPVILFSEFLLTGEVFNLSGIPVLNQISYLTSARWGYLAGASTVNLERIERLRCTGVHISSSCNRLQVHSSGTWLVDAGVLLALSLLAAAGAWRAIRPLGTPRKA